MVAEIVKSLVHDGGINAGDIGAHNHDCFRTRCEAVPHATVHAFAQVAAALRQIAERGAKGLAHTGFIFPLETNLNGHLARVREFSGHGKNVCGHGVLETARGLRADRGNEPRLRPARLGAARKDAEPFLEVTGLSQQVGLNLSTPSVLSWTSSRRMSKSSATNRVASTAPLQKSLSIRPVTVPCHPFQRSPRHGVSAACRL